MKDVDDTPGGPVLRLTDVALAKVLELRSSEAVSYTHLTLPTNREV